MRTVAGLLSIVVGLSGQCLVAQHLRFAEGSFGYVRSDGTELIALGWLVSPSRFRAALCSRAQILQLTYVRKQAERPTSDVRQVANTFSNQPGDVFRVMGGTGAAGETCYLSADTTLVASAGPVDGRDSGECDGRQRRRMSEATHRTVLHCWRLGSAQGNVRFFAVQFGSTDRSVLNSLVVIDQDGFFLHDFPKMDFSPNRVFSPKALSILFFCHPRGAHVIGLTWGDVEGQDSYLLVADSADTFRRVATSYRYWFPY